MAMIHGLTKHPLFKVWSGMRDRCYTTTDAAYKYYGARGILICDEWVNDFKCFYDWAISNGWQKGLEIDRRKNDKGYSPENCRFVTSKNNCRNRRSNVIITYEGKSLCVTEWAEIKGLTPDLIFGRIKEGRAVDRLFEPAKKFNLLTIGKVTKTLTEWAREKGLAKETVTERYKKGVRGDKLFYKGNMRSFEKTYTSH